MTLQPHPLEQAPEEPKPALGEGTIPLPAVPPSTATINPNRGRGLNGILVFLVLALAFLLASFSARNSDLWFHLATGRLLANGEFTFGTDPFAYTTQHVYWACHSWLFDLALYGLRGRIGDAGLVGLKALLVAVLAGLLFRIRRPNGPAWLPLVGTTLALLAMSPRLLLQPACLSYFFLGLTFWLLWRPHRRAESKSGGTSSVALTSAALLLVFVLWVNVDEWFFLGPLLTALFWLGERLSGERRTPGWLVPVGLAVCLLNPYTYHAFTLPAELSPVPWTSGLRQDVRFHTAFAAPWGAEYRQAALHFHASVLAYYALTLLGLVSFLLHRPALRDWRLLIWLPFAVLAAWQARLLPYFAVVAAPITALNWQDMLMEGTGAQMPKSRFLAGLSNLAMLLGLLALLPLTWLGWLAGYDREERHVAWGVQEDPSLREAAETLDRWRRRGQLPDSERVFALSPEVVHYCVWFCPGVKHFFDHRYPLFPQVASEYETVCSALLHSEVRHGQETVPQQGVSRPPVVARSPDRATQVGDWQKVLREHQVGIVVFHDRDWQRLFPVLNRLSSDSASWTLLHVAGQALLVGWNKACPSAGFTSLAFDPERSAFGPQDSETQEQVPPAPGQGPAQLPRHRDLWERLAHPAATPSWESAAATAYLYYFQNSAADQQKRQELISFSSFAASLAGLPAQPSGVTQAAFQVFTSRKLLFPEEAALQFFGDMGPYLTALAERPPALPLLAVRAARRAVAADPYDANAWLRLGQAYLLLRDLTCERSAAGLLPPLVQLRHVQIATALEQAVRLDPNLEAAHHELAFLYGPSNALDQSLEHRREELRLSRQAGPIPGETAKDFAYRLELLDTDTAKLVALVEDNRKQFAAGARSFPGDRVEQAKQALRKWGLARQAVDEILLATPADVLGPEGIRLELDLMLSLGRAEEVRDILNDRGLRASRHVLGISEVSSSLDRDNVRLHRAPYRWPAYEWLHMLAAAAMGDYSQCREDLRTIRAAQQGSQEQLRLQARNWEGGMQALLPSLVTGPGPYLPAFVTVALAQAVQQKAESEATLQSLGAQQADVCVLEGLLALEQGNVEAARTAFAEAMKLGADVPFAGRPIAAAYLGKLRE